MQLTLIKNKSGSPGFTLMELMVVTIIVAIIAGFALPNFSKAMNKARVRDAMAQLSAIYAANMIERAKNGSFLVATYAHPITIPRLNAATNAVPPGLGINLVANGLQYSYTGTPGAFTAQAGAGGFLVEINNGPVNPLPQGTPGGNPCCRSGGTTCPGLGDC